MSEVRVNKLSPRSGTTVTLGDSGDTISIPSGVTLANSGTIDNLNADNLTSGTVPSARISGAYTGITQTGTLASFASTGIDDNATSTAITINSSQNVGIGTSSPVSVANIETTKTTALSTANDFLTLGLTVDDNTAKNENVGGGISFRGVVNNSGGKSVFAAIDGVKSNTAGNDVDGVLRFFTNNSSTGVPTEHMRINSSGAMLLGTTTVGSAGAGDLSVNGGIFLGGTGTANKLDDYEEGTWTPSLRDYGGTPTITYASYLKIGKMVYGSLRITLDGTSDSSQFIIDNLPFTPISDNVWGAYITFTNSTVTTPSRFQITDNSNSINGYQYTGSRHTYNSFGNDKDLRLNYMYETA